MSKTQKLLQSLKSFAKKDQKFQYIKLIESSNLYADYKNLQTQQVYNLIRSHNRLNIINDQNVNILEQMLLQKQEKLDFKQLSYICLAFQKISKNQDFWKQISNRVLKFENQENQEDMNIDQFSNLGILIFSLYNSAQLSDQHIKMFENIILKHNLQLDEKNLTMLSQVIVNSKKFQKEVQDFIFTQLLEGFPQFCLKNKILNCVNLSIVGDLDIKYKNIIFRDLSNISKTMQFSSLDICKILRSIYNFKKDYQQSPEYNALHELMRKQVKYFKQILNQQSSKLQDISETAFFMYQLNYTQQNLWKKIQQLYIINKEESNLNFICQLNFIIQKQENIVDEFNIKIQQDFKILINSQFQVNNYKQRITYLKSFLNIMNELLEDKIFQMIKQQKKSKNFYQSLIEAIFLIQTQQRQYLFNKLYKQYLESLKQILSKHDDISLLIGIMRVSELYQRYFFTNKDKRIIEIYKILQENQKTYSFHQRVLSNFITCKIYYNYYMKLNEDLILDQLVQNQSLSLELFMSLIQWHFYKKQNKLIDINRRYEFKNNSLILISKNNHHQFKSYLFNAIQSNQEIEIFKEFQEFFK